MLAGVLATTGCGAGLIALGANQQADRPAEVPAPELSLTPLMPLVPAPNTERSVVVANAQIATTAEIRVRIEAAGVGVDQQNPVASGQGGSTSITFTLATDPIVATIADPTAADVDATISVLVDDRLVASPVPITLVRQPRATLVVGGGATELFVSPLGERVRLRVEGLRSEAASDVQLLVTTQDPDAVAAPGQPVPVLTRVSTDLRFEASTGGPPEISAFVPGNTFPVRAELVVQDAIAGVSTTVTNAYYRPDVALALPSQGPTTGGSLLTLIGTALVPYDFTAGSGPAPFAFDDVSLSFAKGGRTTELPREDLRIADSGSDRLVFTMPPSPDGRPGQVDIVLRVQLGDVTAEVIASQVFLFANPDPFFGPRGIVLDQLPVAIAAIALDQAPSTQAAPDFAALTDQGGVAFLQLLLAQQNGMFQAFAAPRQIGNHEVAAEREPRDLCVGDFDGDAVPDVFLVNAGAGTAVQHLVLGQAAPLPPLGAVHRFPTPGGMYRCRAARFDADAVPDVLLVPGPQAAPGQLPLVLLARPVAVGQPAFLAPVELNVRSFAYEAVEVADLDGDGALDVALVSGTEGKLDVVYGVGDGTFGAAVPLDFTVPNYTPHPDSPAVGLHACADGSLQSLGLVLSGLLSSFGGGPTQPMVAVLRQPTLRTYASPVPVDTFIVPSEPIGRSLVADLDQQPPIEMVLGIRGEPQFVSFGLLQLSPTGGFLPILGGIEGGIVTGAESPRQISALVFDRAFPVTTSGEPKAVFVVHETEVDGGRERRLSTRLVLTSSSGPPKLLPPDAGAQVNFRIENVVAGNFHSATVPGAGSVRDLALARTTASAPTDAIVLVANDGFGGFPQFGNRCDFPGLLPDSVALLPGAAGQVDALAFCGRDSRLGVWRHDPQGASVQAPDVVSAPLRDLVTDPVLAAQDLADTTRVCLGDVDGDGLDDLVVLLRFAQATPTEDQAALVLLRGRAAVGPGELPFVVPNGVTLVHGSASAFALGDFARTGASQVRQLELAVAVPEGAVGTDGDHVRFFRYQAGATPADDRLVPGAAPGGPQVLLAGSKPTQLAAADFDRDGSIDLLVACRGDSTLRLFRNSAGVATGSGAVVVAAFSESSGSPWQLAAGVPTLLQLSDVNGDGSLDAVAFAEATTSGQNSTAVGLYLSSGAGAFDGPRNVSPTRIGNRNAHLSGDLGDWNRDGLPDLFLGWNTSATGDINLRVLFGGTR